MAARQREAKSIFLSGIKVNLHDLLEKDWSISWLFVEIARGAVRQGAGEAIYRWSPKFVQPQTFLPTLIFFFWHENLGGSGYRNPTFFFALFQVK